MDDFLSENAALYALGLLTGDELAAFELALREDPALCEEVRAFADATLALANSAPQVAPPSDLREKILAGFPAAKPDKPVPAALVTTAAPHAPGASDSPPQTIPNILHFIPWAAAAVLAFMLYQQHRTAEGLAQETATLRSTNTEVLERERHYLEAIHTSESSKTETAAALSAARASLRKAEAELAALGQEKSTLTTELAALKQDSQLDQTRIAVLGSLLKNQPKAVAVSLWRQQTQQGLLVVENLPALPAGRDYQLWVIDPNHKSPVSAGVFKVDVDGKVRIEFKPAQPVRDASKFAVTVEQEGGSPTPHLDQLVVIGG